MKFIDIALNDLKLTLRNKVSALLLVILPMLMISLMGYALKPVFEAGKSIKKVEAAYVNNDTGTIGKSFDSYLRKYTGDYIKLVPVSDNNAENYISSKKGDIAIIVPSDLSQKILNGDKASINVLSSGKDQIKDSVVKSVVNSYIESLNTSMNLIKNCKSYSPDISDAKISEHVSLLMNKYSSNYINSLQDKSANTSSFQYFTASMLLFFVLYSGIGVGSSILIDRTDKMYMRINSFPVTDNQYLTGKILSNAAVSVIQALIILLFSRFVFNVNWGNTTGVIITILLTMLISSSTGILFSSIINSPKSLNSSLTIIFWIIVFLGGGFSPIPSLEPYGKYNFYKWALDSLSSFMTGGGFRDTANNLIMLLIMSLIIWILGLMLYKRRVNHE